MTKTKRPPNATKGTEKIQAAYREAGHFIAAKSFGVAQMASVWEIENSPGASQFTGKTTFAPTSPFNESVIGWSGALAEMMVGKIPRRWKADCELIWKKFAANQLSVTDSDLIKGHAETRKSFKAAVKLLSDNFPHVKQTAETLFQQDSFIAFP